MSANPRAPRDAFAQSRTVDDPDLGGAILFCALEEVARARPSVMGALITRLAMAGYCRLPKGYLA